MPGLSGALAGQLGSECAGAASGAQLAIAYWEGPSWPALLQRLSSGGGAYEASR